MSNTTKTTRKRKSGDDVVPAAKKAKVADSADRPAPLKSALKKSKVETSVAEPKVKKTKASSGASKEPVVQKPEISDDEEGGAELTADRTAELLAGFSSSEDEDEFEEGIAISKLPAAPAPKASTKTSTADPETTPGVVYISRIPHGFYEPQMRAYFSQFGSITHLRLARNKSTGKSQHHAFVEFDSAAVADIVAKTMDKYLLFGHILQCRRVPQEQIKEGIWDKGKGKVRKGGVGKVRNRIEGSRLKKGTGRTEWEGRVEREEKRRAEKAEKLKEMGYEFEMPEIKKVVNVPLKVVEDTAAGAEEEGSVELVNGEDEATSEKKLKKAMKKALEPTIEKPAEEASEKKTEVKVKKSKNKVTVEETKVTKKGKVKSAA